VDGAGLLNRRRAGHHQGSNMPKARDATTKVLLDSDPQARLDLLLGRRLGKVRVLSADLSTQSVFVDRFRLFSVPRLSAFIRGSWIRTCAKQKTPPGSLGAPPVGFHESQVVWTGWFGSVTSKAHWAN
jgi:hypothetical protein